MFKEDRPASVEKNAFVEGISILVSDSEVGFWRYNWHNHIGSLHAIRTNGEIIRKVLFVSVGVMMITLLVKYFTGF